MLSMRKAVYEQGIIPFEEYKETSAEQLLNKLAGYRSDNNYLLYHVPLPEMLSTILPIILARDTTIKIYTEAINNVLPKRMQNTIDFFRKFSIIPYQILTAFANTYNSKKVEVEFGYCYIFKTNSYKNNEDEILDYVIHNVNGASSKTVIQWKW